MDKEDAASAADKARRMRHFPFQVQSWQYTALDTGCDTRRYNTIKKPPPGFACQVAASILFHEFELEVLDPDSVSILDSCFPQQVVDAKIPHPVCEQIVILFGIELADVEVALDPWA